MSQAAQRILAALGCGMLFGLGLAISGMTDPARVRAFLDVAGAWDPRLLFVLGGAVTAAFAGFRLAGRFPRPVLDERFFPPAARPVDRRLVAGSALFGVGWGLVGLCPGPAVVDLATGPVAVVLFICAMLAGAALHGALVKPAERSAPLQ
jgi:hypothetical protein